MARCGCAGNVCTCLILPGTNTEVSGSGTETDPYQVHARLANLVVRDTPSVDLTLVGNGSETLPYELTADLAVPPVTGAGSRNLVDNGDFGIATKGNGPFTGLGPSFFVDRWYKTGSGGSIDASRVQTPFNAGGGVNGADWFSRLVISGQSAAGHYAYVSQDMERVRTLAGRVACLSFLANSPDSIKVGVEIKQHLGTGTPGVYAYYLAAGVVQINPTWEQHYLSFLIPSLAGKGTGALAGDDTDTISVTFWLSSGTTNAVRAQSIGIQNKTFEFTDVQLEPGAGPTSFERKPRFQQIAAARRYYQRKVADNANLGTLQRLSTGGYVAAANIARVDFALSPPMRSYPGISYDATLANYAVQTPDGTYPVSAISQIMSERDMTTLNVTTTTSTMTLGRPAALVRAGATPTFIAFSAEL